MRRRWRRCSLLLIAAAATPDRTTAARGTTVGTLHQVNPHNTVVGQHQSAVIPDGRHVQARRGNGGKQRHKKKKDIFAKKGGVADVASQSEGSQPVAGSGTYVDTFALEKRHSHLPDEHNAVNFDVEFEYPPTGRPTEAPTVGPTPTPTAGNDPCLAVNGVIGTSDTAERFTVDYVYETETKRRATINSMPEVVTTIEALVSEMLADLVDPECAFGSGSGDNGGIGDKIVGISVDPVDEVLPLRSNAGKCMTETQTKFNKCFVVRGGITFHLENDLSEEEREAIIDRIISTFGGDNGSGVDNSDNADFLAKVRDDIVRITLILPSRRPPPTVSPKPSTEPPTLSPEPTVSPTPQPTISPRPTTLTKEPTITMEPTDEPTLLPTTELTISPTTAFTEKPTDANFCDGTSDGFAGTIADNRVRVRYQYEVETRPIVTAGMMVDTVLPLIEVAVSDMLLPTVFAECRGDGDDGGGNVDNGNLTGGFGENGTAIDSSVSLRSFVPKGGGGGRKTRGRALLTTGTKAKGKVASQPRSGLGALMFLRSKLVESRRFLQQNLGRIVGISARPNDKVLSGETCREITAQGDNTCTVVDGDLSLYLSGPESDEGELVLKIIEEALDGFELDNIDPAHIVRIRYRPVQNTGVGPGVLSSDTVESVVYESWFPYTLAFSILFCCIGVGLVIYGWRKSKAGWDDPEAEQLHEAEQGGYDDGAYNDAEGEQLHEAEQGGYDEGYQDQLDAAEGEQLHEAEQLQSPEHGYYGGYQDGGDTYNEGYDDR